MADAENQEEQNFDARDDQQPEPEGHQPPEGQRPPDEQDWPTNGGPLGCLLGALAGFLAGGFLGTTLLIFDRPIALALTVVLTIGLAIAGWKIGRSIFREYKAPKPRRAKK